MRLSRLSLGALLAVAAFGPAPSHAESPEWYYFLSKLVPIQANTITEIVQSGRYKDYKYGINVCAPDKWDGKDLTSRGLKFNRLKLNDVRKWQIPIRREECDMLVMSNEGYMNRMRNSDSFKKQEFIRPIGVGE